MERILVTRTSQRLRDLLATRPDYAIRWNSRVGRQQAHEIHQSAICHVLADYLWENGIQPATEPDLARKLKDRVHRALNGQSLSRATLRWFIEAFEMTPTDAAELIRLRTPGRPGDTVLGGMAPEPGVPGRQRYATVSVHERHSIGPDGLPDSHRTVHTVQALESMTHYTTQFDTDTASVQVLRGGRAGRPYAISHGLFAVDVELEHPLRAGERRVIEYVIRFWHRAIPAQEFRSITATALENVDLRVQFHPLRLPAKVWWCEWPTLDGAPVYEEEMGLDAAKGVTRIVPSMEATALGFRWAMPRRTGLG